MDDKVLKGYIEKDEMPDGYDDEYIEYNEEKYDEISDSNNALLNLLANIAKNTTNNPFLKLVCEHKYCPNIHYLIMYLRITIITLLGIIQ